MGTLHLFFLWRLCTLNPDSTPSLIYSCKSTTKCARLVSFCRCGHILNEHNVQIPSPLRHTLRERIFIARFQLMHTGGITDVTTQLVGK